MHKLGHRIIKDNYSRIGLKNDFQVLSSNNLKEILMMDWSQALGAKRQNAGDTIWCMKEGKCNPTDSFKCKLCLEYTKLLRKFNYIDHDEQILIACKLLRENKDILINEQKKAKYLLVEISLFSLSSLQAIKICSS